MEEAHLIVGLGNPGPEYEKTRHNAGFLAIDRLCQEWGCELRLESKFKARVTRVTCGQQIRILCQPQTFMNASGRAVGKVVTFFKVPVANVVVLVDDADLDFGAIRLRPRGRSAGHNGLKSIAEAIGTEDFARLKIGIGRQVKGALKHHVLGRFDVGELNLLERVLDRVTAQVQTVVTEGVETAMNRFNGRITREELEN